MGEKQEIEATVGHGPPSIWELLEATISSVSCQVGYNLHVVRVAVSNTQLAKASPRWPF